MTVRLWMTALLLLGALAANRSVGHGQPVRLQAPFAAFPLSIERWHGRAMHLSSEIESRLGVSDYVNRVYSRGPREVVSLYVGYYESQRHGEMIHSPKNCLPGSGWYIAERDTMRVDVPSFAPFDVNRFVIENGIDRQLVLYWYQQAGSRIVRNEYLGRMYLVWDAFRLNRTDAALVRLTIPFEDAGSAALPTATAFLRDMYPQLMQFLPSAKVAAKL